MQLTANGMIIANGVAVLKHVGVVRSREHDLKKYKQKMGEVRALGMKQRNNLVTPMLVQVDI